MAAINETEAEIHGLPVNVPNASKDFAF